MQASTSVRKSWQYINSGQQCYVLLASFHKHFFPLSLSLIATNVQLSSPSPQIHTSQFSFSPSLQHSFSLTIEIQVSSPSLLLPNTCKLVFLFSLTPSSLLPNHRHNLCSFFFSSSLPLHNHTQSTQLSSSLSPSLLTFPHSHTSQCSFSLSLPSTEHPIYTVFFSPSLLTESIYMLEVVNEP